MEGVQLRVRWGAGILALGVLLGAVTGVVWGLFRPGYAATVVDGSPRVDPIASPDSVEFASFGWFVILSALLGLVIGLAAYSSAERESSAARMLFVVFVAVFSSWALYVLGGWSARLVHPEENAHTGGSFTVVPAFNPGVGWAAAPFMAALSYWVGMVTTAAVGEKQR